MGKVNENIIRNICEACRLVLLREDNLRFEEGLDPLTSLQREIMRQKYRDKAVEFLKPTSWEEVYDTFDRVYKENEESHKNDGQIFA